ncbi:MAG: hypothetical protein SFV15_14145 [Polyangiaceae bacterium]|nr:hypothetical protein [Polyangiaceae bacterium]
MNSAIVTILERNALGNPLELAQGEFWGADAGFRHATVVQSPGDEEGRELLARASRRFSLLGRDASERRRVVLHVGPDSSAGLRACRALLCERAVQWLSQGKGGSLRLVASGPLRAETRHELLELAGAVAAGSASASKVRVALNFDGATQAVRAVQSAPPRRDSGRSRQARAHANLAVF